MGGAYLRRGGERGGWGIEEPSLCWTYQIEESREGPAFPLLVTTCPRFATGPGLHASLVCVLTHAVGFPCAPRAGAVDVVLRARPLWGIPALCRERAGSPPASPPRRQSARASGEGFRRSPGKEKGVTSDTNGHLPLLPQTEGHTPL